MKITLCGSMTFYPEMERIASELKRMGHEALVPLLRMGKHEWGMDRTVSLRAYLDANGGPDAFPEDHAVWEEKSAAIDDHFQKVTWSDAILVVNYPKRGIDGYIGGNTLMEIAVARYLRKGIYFLFPVSKKLTYKEELIGVRPIILNNDLSKVGETKQLMTHSHARAS
jgi:hypothetical protein